MRVVRTAAYGGPYPGAFIPMLEAARGAIQSHGWSFEPAFSRGVEARAWYRDLQAAGVKMHVPPPMGIRTAVTWLRALASGLAPPAVLHSHFTNWDVPVALAALGAPTAVLWHIHSPLSRDLAVRARNTMRFGVLGRSVDRILCVSPDVRDEVVRRCAPAGRTELFPNAINAGPVALLDARARAAARARMDVPADVTVLLLFAHDWQRKGGRLFFETVRELIRRGRRVFAVIVGAPESGRTETRALGLAETVRLVAPVDDARLLYGAADILIAASTAEGMPFAVLEALSAGVPIVASDIPSHRYVADSMPGCRLTARDAMAFADAVQAEIGSEPQVRSARLARSRAYVERALCVSGWAERLVRLHEEILRGRRSSSRQR